MFTTYPTSVFTLPDDRVVEMVTPPEGQDANVYVPDAVLGSNGDATTTELPFQAAADGNVVVYLGLRPRAATVTRGAEAATSTPPRALRRAAGRRSIFNRPVTDPRSIADSRAIFRWGSSARANRCQLMRRRRYEVLYSRSTADGSANALFTTTPVVARPRNLGLFIPKG